MTITGTKWEKFLHYAKLSVLHLLVFIAIGAVIYGKVTKYVADKEQSVLKAQVSDLQKQLEASNSKLPN